MATLTSLPSKHTPEWTLGDRMAKARRDAGFTAQEIAARIGISRKSVWNYEHDTTKPLTPILRAWAEVTGTYVEWIETGESPFPRGLDGEKRDVTGRKLAERPITGEYDDVSPLIGWAA